MSAYDYYRLHPAKVVSKSGTTLGLTQAEEDYIEDASFTRLRELSVTWTMPQNAARLMRVAQSSLTVGGRNLAVITDYKGYDPELLAIDDRPGEIFKADLFTVPPARRLFVRLNLQF